jgi:uncharacterized protein
MKKQVKVKPNAKKQHLIQESDGSLTVHLQSSPVDGKANAELIQVLSKTFEVPKSAVKIKLGLTSRQKLVEIDLEDN